MNKKDEKKEIVTSINNLLNSNSVLILLNYKGLDAKGMSVLRKTLKNNDANLKIFKNTLVKRAIADTKISCLIDNFKDQVAISYSNDPISLSSVLVKLAKDNDSIEIKSGFMNGEKMEISMIESLASLGSANDVKSKFIGLLHAFSAKFIRILNAYESKLKDVK